MLTPRYLARAPEPIVLVYAELESEILLDIVSRIGKVAKMGYIDASRVVVSELSAFNKAASAQIAAHLNISQPELIALVNKSIIDSLQYDDAIYQRMQAAGALPKYINLRQSRVLQKSAENSVYIMSRDFAAHLRATQAAASALLGRELSSVITAKDYAFFDFKNYIGKTIRKLGHQGITVIETDGRGMSMEAYVRREIITGINTSASKASIMRASEVGSDLVATSQHYGARPEHALWQGKVFSLSGTSTKYPDFKQSTGYGTITGLCGINCRHSFYPYFPGYSTPDEPLNAQRNAEQYQLEQMQRNNERNIRQWKRINKMENAEGLDSTYSAAKVREWQAKNRELIADEPWLARDYNREQIG